MSKKQHRPNKPIKLHRPLPNKPMALVGRAHPVLHMKAEPILASELDDFITLAGRMLATVRAKGGIAIAAPQVGVPVQLIVQWDGNVLINPEIEIDEEGGSELGIEACLSVPGRSFQVERFNACSVSAWDIMGDRKEYDAVGLDARMIQHETDHLNGVIIADIGKEVSGTSSGLRL